MEDTTTLQFVWFLLISILWVGYLILEGFDFGVGILFKLIGSDKAEKRAILHSIGPFWDGNEVWLVTGGGALFAAFPPVYYSAPVPRTYGYSPFAYPPGVMTPDLVETVSEPQVIENPYISPAPTGEGPAMIAPETVDQTTSVAPIRGPQVILNPYVSQTGGASGMASAAGGASVTRVSPAMSVRPGARP